MKIISSVILVIFLLFGITSIYTVHEGQRSILLRLGKIVTTDSDKARIFKPGLHFKLPIVHTARIFDVRLQTTDVLDSKFVTVGKKFVVANYYVKWRITDLAQYFVSTSGNRLKAEGLLEKKINDGLRAEFGKRTIKEIVTGARADIMSIVQKDSNTYAKNLGVTVVDVRIKRIDLPPTVSSSVYERMRAERKRVATEHRSLGRSKAEAIRAQADANVTVRLASADRDAKGIRGEGEAEAARIYADAYNQGPNFYAFLRSLQAYQQSFANKQDILVLKPDSQFFKYFNRMNPSSKMADRLSRIAE